MGFKQRAQFADGLGVLRVCAGFFKRRLESLAGLRFKLPEVKLRQLRQGILGRRLRGPASESKRDDREARPL